MTATATATATTFAFVKSIRLNRGEGRTEDCNRPVEVATFAEAARTLRRWSNSAPREQDGGYHKCDFTVTFTDGSVYSGRYDLQRRDDFMIPRIEDQCLRTLLMYTGRKFPAHMTASACSFVRNRMSAELLAEARTLLFTCHFSDHPGYRVDLLETGSDDDVPAAVVTGEAGVYRVGRVGDDFASRFATPEEAREAAAGIDAVNARVIPYYA